MSSGETKDGKAQEPQISRRPYVKPAFSSEQAFEVNALTCVKVSAGSGCGAPTHLT